MSNWIKCSERLPDELVGVWLHGTHSNAVCESSFEGYLHNGKLFAYNNGDYIDGGYGQNYNAVVTHWQPLPEPPEAE